MLRRGRSDGNAGLRNGAAFWSQGGDGPTVLAGVARFTRVCGYDRPGTILTSTPPFELSRSSPVRMPRTAADAVSDLNALLRVAKVPGPYVFVSHSLGGLIDRLWNRTASSAASRRCGGRSANTPFATSPSA